MYVCLCKGITDRQIRAAMSEGNTTVRALKDSLGITSQCGRCARLTKEIVKDSSKNTSGDLFYSL